MKETKFTGNFIDIELDGQAKHTNNLFLTK